MKPLHAVEILFLKRGDAETLRTQSMAVRRRRHFLCISASLRFLFVVQLTGCAIAADPALLTEARQALAESIPQVAVQKLKTLLAKTGVPAADRRAAQLELGAAYLAAENDEAALAAVQTLADKGDAAAQLLRAQVFARAGWWKEALALFEELAAPADAPARRSPTPRPRDDTSRREWSAARVCAPATSAARTPKREASTVQLF